MTKYYAQLVNDPFGIQIRVVPEEEQTIQNIFPELFETRRLALIAKAAEITAKFQRETAIILECLQNTPSQ